MALDPKSFSVQFIDLFDEKRTKLYFMFQNMKLSMMTISTEKLTIAQMMKYGFMRVSIKFAANCGCWGG